MNYSAAATKNNGEPVGKAFETKQEAEDYILDLMEKEELKAAYIRNLNTGEQEKIV